MTGFNGDEIFEMAEQLERNGGRFYRQAGANTTGETRDLLLKLAAMEEDHEKTFSRLRAELGPSLVFDPDNEGARYLQAMMVGKVFPGGDTQKLTGHESVAEVLEIAISFEKETVLFFTGLRAVAAGEEAKKTFDTLIRQEVGHLADLSYRLWEIRG